MKNILLQRVRDFLNQNKYDVLEVLFSEFKENIITGKIDLNSNLKFVPQQSDKNGWRLFFIKEYDGDYCIIYTVDAPRGVFFLDTNIKDYFNASDNIIISEFNNTSLKHIKGESISVLNNKLSITISTSISNLGINQFFDKPIDFKLGYIHPKLKGVIKT